MPAPARPLWRARPPLWLVTAGAIGGGAAAALVLDAAVPGADGRAATAILLALAALGIGLVALLVLAILIAPERAAPTEPRVPPALLAAAFGLGTGATAFVFALLIAGGSREAARVAEPLLGVVVAATLVLVAATVDQLLRRARPIDDAARIGAAAVQGIRRRSAVFLAGRTDLLVVPAEGATVVPAREDGVVQSIDGLRLARLAAWHDCRIVAPAVGARVAAGDPLLVVHGGRSAPPATRLRRTVRVGERRHARDDPAHALRLLVDLTTRALAPALPDPTTAVRVLDQMEPVLLALGGQERTGVWMVTDAGGEPRVALPAPRWEDLLTLALTEVRDLADTAPQVARRLRALLDRLAAEVRPEHRHAVAIELAELGSTVRRGFPDPVLRRFAAHPDPEGIGGSVPGSSRWGDALPQPRT